MLAYPKLSVVMLALARWVAEKVVEQENHVPVNELEEEDHEELGCQTSQRQSRQGPSRPPFNNYNVEVDTVIHE